MSQSFTGSTISSLVDNKVVDGRLTLATATPVTTTDQLAKTTVYFTPYKGNRIALYDGSAWQMVTFSEVSVAVPATTTTPFDIWGVLSGGALTLETTNWTNDTTRATALALQDGVQSKTGDLTRRYLGTGRTTGVSGQIEDSYGGASQAGGKRFLWNYYNRIIRHIAVIDTTASWTMGVATWRAANNNSNNRVSLVIGWREDPVKIYAQHGYPINDGTNAVVDVGIGIDSTTVNSATLFGSASSTASADYGSPSAAYLNTLAIGGHIIYWLEQTTAGTMTVYNNSYVQTGLIAEVMA